VPAPEGSGHAAAALVDALLERSATVAVAESLTGGRLCAALIDRAGASAAVRGGVVAYHADVKTGVLGVSEALVATHGTVAAQTAEAMAVRVAALLAADWGIATTGVAGPGPSEGHPPGRAYVAVAGPGRVVHRLLALSGDRDTIREGTVRAACVLALAELVAR
jgi:nicotinamide-nucleotide amidase